MSTLFCNSCNTENHCLSIKCEQCKTKLPQECLDSIENDLENDYNDIDRAEMKGNIIQLEEHENYNFQLTIINGSIAQAIKEEPEVQIDADIEDNSKRKPIETKGTLTLYKCPDCSHCFKRKSALLSHIKVAHGSSDSEQEISKEPTHHSHNEPKLARNKPTPQPIEKSSQPLAPLIKIFKCDQCNDFFKNPEELKSHRIECAKKEKIFCGVCNLFFNHKPALIKHNKSKQHNLNKNNPPTELEYKFICVFCGERFQFQIQLTNHKRVHTANNDKVGGAVEFVCTICGQTSSDRSIHTRHLRVHAQQTLATCDLCGSKFTTRSSLNRHMVLHTDERPYKCDICGVDYRHRRNLDKHLFRHTGQRPFKCEYCNKTFALRFVFNDHVRLKHTRETPYACEVCTESFRTSYLLNFHRREEHNIDTNSKRRVNILKKVTSQSEN